MRPLPFSLFALLLLSPLYDCSSKYTKEGCQKDEFGNEQCVKPDEYESKSKTSNIESRDVDEDDDDDDEPVFYEIEEKLREREKLFQWDPVEVGHVRELDMGNGNTIKMVTAALKPKIFIIDDFLTPQESDHIIEKAKHFGLGSSGLHIDAKVADDKVYTFGRAKNTFGVFQHWDQNFDGLIDMKEIISLAKRNLRLYINETDVQQMLEKLNIGELEDGKITLDEFERLNTAGIADYMNNLREQHPRFRDRFSEQTWLKQTNSSDYIMKNLREKVIKLTNLPRYIVEGGEPLQVLNYKPFGHYHAHFDGQDEKEFPDHKCCHMDLETQPFACRLCRFVTIVYYLNDVEEGGETAFPVADDPNYNHTEFQKRKGDDLYNLSMFCHKAKLVVKPKRGRAVMWYNHHIDENGWLGEMDYYALHGGCDIKKGEKWMANNWLTAPPTKYAHLDSLYAHIETLGGAF